MWLMHWQDVNYDYFCVVLFKAYVTVIYRNIESYKFMFNAIPYWRISYLLAFSLRDNIKMFLLDSMQGEIWI